MFYKGCKIVLCYNTLCSNLKIIKVCLLYIYVIRRIITEKSLFNKFYFIFARLIKHITSWLVYYALHKPPTFSLVDNNPSDNHSTKRTHVHQRHSKITSTPTVTCVLQAHTKTSNITSQRRDPTLTHLIIIINNHGWQMRLSIT